MIHVLVGVEKNINNAMVSKMNKGLITAILFLFGFFNLSGQVTITEEPSIIRLMQVYKSKNAQNPVARAWRIQIITTSNRREMETAYQKFERLYPHVNYEWEHDPPYYKVKAGAFEKKEELEAILLELKKEFPLSIPVQDDISKRDLIDY